VSCSLFFPSERHASFHDMAIDTCQVVQLRTQ
jgi:hypothetical protein